MDFDLNEEQIMFRDMAREFAKRELSYDKIREFEREDKIDHELHKKLGQAGFLGMVFPKEYGGLELGYTTACAVLEEFARADESTGTRVGETALPGIPIVVAGTDEQKQKYLPSLITGEKTMTTASTEPDAGSDGGAIQTIAKLEGDEWVLNGAKAWIGSAAYADTLIVHAQTDKSKGYKGLAIFIVDSNTTGVHISPIKHIIIGRTGTANIRFVNCRIPKKNMVGEVGDGLRLVQLGINIMRLYIAICAVGMAQGCLDMCVEYSKNRYQFGKPIASFQLVQATLADMATEIEAARWMCYHLAYLKDKGVSHRKETSMTKLFATEMAGRVTTKAVHLHGAYACSDDLPLETHFRGGPVSTTVGGTSEVHRLIIARELTGINAIS
jgi:butyryl-CoA dehydrogenase